MKFSKGETKLIKEALSYGILYSRSEAETAEFELLRTKVEIRKLVKAIGRLRFYCK